METDKVQKPEYIEHQENHNCQQFFGPISGCVFAMPGSTVNMHTPQTSQDNAKQVQNGNKVDAAIKAVFDANLCESPDWAAVVQLLQERGLKQPNGLPYDADYINRVCENEVTSSLSIARSIFFIKVAGRYPNWRIKEGEETRETKNKLIRYQEIGRIAIEILGA